MEPTLSSDNPTRKESTRKYIYDPDRHKMRYDGLNEKFKSLEPFIRSDPSEELSRKEVLKRILNLVMRLKRNCRRLNGLIDGFEKGKCLTISFIKSLRLTNYSNYLVMNGLHYFDKHFREEVESLENKSVVPEEDSEDKPGNHYRKPIKHEIGIAIDNLKKFLVVEKWITDAKDFCQLKVIEKVIDYIQYYKMIMETQRNDPEFISGMEEGQKKATKVAVDYFKTNSLLIPHLKTLELHFEFHLNPLHLLGFPAVPPDVSELLKIFDVPECLQNPIDPVRLKPLLLKYAIPLSDQPSWSSFVGPSSDTLSYRKASSSSF
uniref:BHLH domain-containing protein n=1 Tax=Caenorhabditis tropicalis TaxID=1561998 RepID=A0A1I7V2F8_9PELO